MAEIGSKRQKNYEKLSERLKAQEPWDHFVEGKTAAHFGGPWGGKVAECTALLGKPSPRQ